MTFIFFALLFALLWGILQGQTMIRSVDIRFSPGSLDPSSYGVRCHVWFRYYHWLIVVTFATFVVAITTWPGDWLLTAGIAFIGWAIFEAAYSWTRYAHWIPYRENVLGTGRYVYGRNVVLLQAARALIGAAIIVWRLA